MIIKRIKLKNFRQFIDVDIDFNAAKNTSIIIGTGGVGKTTLFEALKWGLFGICKYPITELVNCEILEKAEFGAVIEVIVEIYVESTDSNYLLINHLKGEKKINRKHSINSFDSKIMELDSNGKYVNSRRDLLFDEKIAYVSFFEDIDQSINRMNNDRWRQIIRDSFFDVSILYDSVNYCRCATRIMKKRMTIDNDEKNEEILLRLNKKISEYDQRLEFLLESEEECKHQIDKYEEMLQVPKSMQNKEESTNDTKPDYMLPKLEGYYNSLMSHLDDIHNEKQSLNKEISRCKSMISRSEEKKAMYEKYQFNGPKIMESLNYLETWALGAYEEKLKYYVCKIEKHLQLVMLDMGFYEYVDVKIKDIFMNQIGVGDWRIKLWYFAFIIACRDVLLEDHKDVSPILFDCDLDFKCFGKVEIEKIMMYLSKRNEQIIILSYSENNVYNYFQDTLDKKYYIKRDNDYVCSVVQNIK